MIKKFLRICQLNGKPHRLLGAEFRRAIGFGAVLLPVLLIGSQRAAATDPLLPGKLRQLISQEESEAVAAGKQFAISLQIVDLENAREVFSHRKDMPLIPASLVKLATSVAALQVLGSEYRFPTEIFVDRKPQIKLETAAAAEAAGSSPWQPPPLAEDGVGRLYLRGYGDPSLMGRDLSELAYALRDRGVRKIEDLVIDDSLFIDPPKASGPEPYQAAVSATSLDHNCYRLLLTPTAAGADALLGVTAGLPVKLVNRVKTLKVKGEKFRVVQKPSSELFNPEALGVRVGAFSKLEVEPLEIVIQGRINEKLQPIEQFRTVPHPPAFLASVFKYYLQQAGVEISGDLLRGEVPASATLLHVRESKPLGDILRELNKTSNNMVAEQLIFALGQDAVGFFRRELGLKRVAEVLTRGGKAPDGFALHDGSGLDRRNRVTTELIAQLLADAFADFSLLPDLISSLSRFGISGTLRERQLIPPAPPAMLKSGIFAQEKRLAHGVWAKTGTLEGVSALAGYLQTRTGSRLAFAVIINSDFPKEQASEIEERLVRAIVGLDEKK